MTFTMETLWLLIGFLGQGIFFSRFVLQWWQSERAGMSVIPTAFWYLSIAGALVILAYALHKRDIVFIAGQGFALLIYARNLMLIRKSKAVRGAGAQQP